MKALFVVCVFLFFCVSYSRAAVAADKITNLPGLSTPPSFNQYSGYVNVTGYGRMFYWFVESQQNPTTDPVVLWLNGGPGCSSLGGLLSENGPWFPNSTLQLVENPYAWNRIANVLYLESPPGVGFSINEASFNVYTDNLTADANYQFLQNWFSLFSEYQGRDFWITGESYAGHYIPTLTYKILQESSNPSAIPLNLQGIAIGNPSTDFDYDTGELYDAYFPTHGLQCLDSSLNGKFGFNGIIDPYDILADVCYPAAIANTIRFPNAVADKTREALALREELFGNSRNIPAMPGCIGNWVTDYLNQPSVQSALHVNPTVWSQCGGPPYQFGQESIIPYYQDFLANTDLRVFIYSGDEDTVLPFIGTETWVLSLNQPAQNTWGPWYSDHGTGPQVAGYWIDMDKLWYATVKGAGHMVPWFTPCSAFDLFSRYITGEPLHTRPFGGN